MTRLPALTPACGRACLIAAGALLALAPLALPDGYDPWRHSVSESAAQGVAGAGWARAGLAAYGLGAMLMAACVRRALAEMAALAVFGVGLLGSAWWPHRPWWPGAAFDAVIDQRHSACARLAGLAFVLAVGLRAMRLRRERGLWRWQEPVVLALALGGAVAAGQSPRRRGRSPAPDVRRRPRLALSFSIP